MTHKTKSVSYRLSAASVLFILFYFLGVGWIFNTLKNVVFDAWKRMAVQSELCLRNVAHS